MLLRHFASLKADPRQEIDLPTADSEAISDFVIAPGKRAGAIVITLGEINMLVVQTVAGVDGVIGSPGDVGIAWIVHRIIGNKNSAIGFGVSARRSA